MSVEPSSLTERTAARNAAGSAGFSVDRAAVWALAVLWLVWAGLLFGGFIFGGEESETASRIPRWCRMWSSVVLVASGWTWLVAAVGTPARRYAALVAVGMTLGFIGDLFNADLIPGVFANGVMGGIISFGLGHIAYIWACLNIERTAALGRPMVRNAALAAWLAIGFFGWLIVTWSVEKNAELRWPALPYSLLLAGTAGLTTGVALRDRRFAPLAAGGALFLISDLILAWELFHGSFHLSRDLVWLTYGPAQMLIVYSVGTAIVVTVGVRRAMQRAYA